MTNEQQKRHDEIVSLVKRMEDELSRLNETRAEVALFEMICRSKLMSHGPFRETVITMIANAMVATHKEEAGAVLTRCFPRKR